MILSVAHTKGGVGKSLLAVNIAVVLAQRGRDVLVIDGDEQDSAATFAQLRAEVPDAVQFATIKLYGSAIRQQMKQLRGRYAEIIIDVGGRDTGSLRAALTVANVALIPFMPRSVDLWTGAKIAALVAEALDVNDTLRACSIINMADAQGRDNAEAIEALKGIGGIDPLPITVARRKAFPNAFTNGMAVTDHVPVDKKAVEEILSVVDALYT
jgi:chromosome partitioning protein